MATYNLELERLKKQGITGVAAEEQAANQAIYVNELTNGGVSAAAAPRFAQNPLGKIVFMYKRYGVSMYYMMFKTFKQATQGDTPEERKTFLCRIVQPELLKLEKMAEQTRIEPISLCMTIPADQK
jgi:hypothetical protein